MDFPYQSDTWYKIDILLDWDLKSAAIFIDGIFIHKVAFYSLDRDILMNCDEAFVNTIMLYNLATGT